VNLSVSGAPPLTAIMALIAPQTPVTGTHNAPLHNARFGDGCVRRAQQTVVRTAGGTATRPVHPVSAVEVSPKREVSVPSSV